ncbi:MAG: proline--tRNA ligase [Alphaproteobacteria bacterium]|nr:proline--tRNA ligase [Alphaproteobacteria bacterium]
MYLSKFFLPTLKESPAEAQLVSHKLMLKSGMIRQAAAGIYSWLPLGLKVLNKIQNIIRKNMEEVGSIEMLMPCIQPSHLWKESGRYDAYGPEMLRIIDRHEAELLFSPTNEELITEIFRSYVKSYKDLPLNLYHIQWKFRDEIRPRFGVMRGREFLMKDGYSFDISKEEALKSYDMIFTSYCKIFKELGLKAIPVRADSGPIGGDLNHEFHILADNGESTIYYDKRFDDIIDDEENLSNLKNLYAAADEMHKPESSECANIEILERKGIEVGHIFYFGTKYSEPMNAKVNSDMGSLVTTHMASYGIGVSRLVAAIIESSHDDKGIIWPKSVAPFQVSIINLATEDELCSSFAETLYRQLKSHNIEVLLDDTNQRAGVKFATSDLIGIPEHVIIGKKKLLEGMVEIKNRKTGISEDYKVEEVLKIILNRCYAA